MNILIESKVAFDLLTKVNERFENGEGTTDEGIQHIAATEGLLFDDVKAYVESF